MSFDHILPVTNDRDTAGFFEACKNKTLVYRVCQSCNAALNPPRAHCGICGSWDTAWREANGRGRLYSWTTVCHQVHPAYRVPYTVVIVELEDAPEVRLVGQLNGSPDLRAGMAMQVWFETLGDGTVLPQWEPIEKTQQGKES